MGFQFFCNFAGGNQTHLDTGNLFEARRQARKLGASELMCKNPAHNNGKAFAMVF